MIHRCLTVAVRPYLATCLTAVALAIGGNAIADAPPSHGDMAAAVRSANLPCAHVQAVDPDGKNRWAVRCNSGVYLVTRGEDGQYTVAKPN